MDSNCKDVQQNLDLLLQAIRQDKKYLRFEAAKRRVEGLDEERRQIDEFRKWAYQVTNDPCEWEQKEENNALLRQRKDLRKNPVVAEYLTAEMELCRLLQKICESVMNVTDLQLDAFIDTIEF